MARIQLSNHRKFRRLVADLGIPRAHARGHLELMWEVGNARGPILGDSLDVEIAAEWAGERGALTAALVAVGFLEIAGKQYRLHDFYHHAPDYVRKRIRRRGGDAVSEASRAANGYVYLMRSGDLHKLGLSTNPEERRRTIELASGRPVELVAKAWVENMAATERSLHKRFAEDRTRGEWFALNEEQVESLLAEWGGGAA